MLHVHYSRAPSALQCKVQRSARRTAERGILTFLVVGCLGHICYAELVKGRIERTTKAFKLTDVDLDIHDIVRIRIDVIYRECRVSICAHSGQTNKDF